MYVNSAVPRTADPSAANTTNFCNFNNNGNSNNNGAANDGAVAPDIVDRPDTDPDKGNDRNT